MRDVLLTHGIDTVVLAGFMRVLSAGFFDAFPGRVLNVHPALLPAFPGAHAVRDALAWGAKVTGVTVHLVDEQVDHGPIVLQEAIEIRDDDDWDSLELRVHALEHRLLPAAVRALLQGRLVVDGRAVRITGEATMSDVQPIRRAILAPYDKTGLVAFATALAQRDVELVASGGTARVLAEAGLAVTKVEDVTGSPEMLGGRVKTLHPSIHAGLLADRRNPDHVRQIEAFGIQPFDLLVGGLYPFRETVASGADADAVIENIDIGGPAMMRAAAKNFESVTVVVDPARYDDILAEIDAEGGVTRATRRTLAAAAFAHTAAYDAAVASWFAEHGDGDDDALPGFVGLAYEKVGDLRYGENPHQRGGLYREAATAGLLGGASVLQGKDMSFNNWLDAYAAYELVGGHARGLGRDRQAQQSLRGCGEGIAR